MTAAASAVRILITMGDPAGIGPEIVLKALQHAEIYDSCKPVVLGDLGVMRNAAVRLGLNLQVLPFVGFYSKYVPTTALASVWQSTSAELGGVIPGQLSGDAGRAAADSVVYGAHAVNMRVADALVTAPINKEAIVLGGYNFAGHTELLADVTGTKKYGMLLLAGSLRVVHVSTHVSLREAIQRVTKARVIECIRLGHRACLDLGISRPRIAVAGLNPHAGENGLFGAEDTAEIRPAISAALRRGIEASGPHPPDTVFARARAGEFDLVVAMYHDQGHIPVKLLGIDNGVNVTIGLPIIRVSVDHGTAFDIAGTGVAREDSMLEAIRVAVQLARRRLKEK